MKKLSVQGVILKKIQIDLGIKAKDFADQIGVQPSYLSAIMHGDRKMPKTFPDRVQQAFDIDRESMFKLRNSDKFDN